MYPRDDFKWRCDCFAFGIEVIEHIVHTHHTLSPDMTFLTIISSLKSLKSAIFPSHQMSQNINFEKSYIKAETDM